MRRRCSSLRLMELERAKKHLEAWYAADLALATSKSYTIDGRAITRANAAEVQQKIAYWRNEVCRIERMSRSVNIGLRVVPRDT